MNYLFIYLLPSLSDHSLKFYSVIKSRDSKSEAERSKTPPTCLPRALAACVVLVGN